MQNRLKIETWMSIKNNEESLPNLLNQILKEAEIYQSNHTQLIQLSMLCLSYSNIYFENESIFILIFLIQFLIVEIEINRALLFLF